VALAYGGALALDGLVKIVFHSARPHLWASPAPETGYGFPSGHAMGSMGLLAARVACRPGPRAGAGRRVFVKVKVGHSIR